MALAKARRGRGQPITGLAIVDMLSTLLLVVTFLMSLFMLTNYFITTQTSGKDTMLSRLNRQLSELTELLALERSKKESVEDSLVRPASDPDRQGQGERAADRTARRSERQDRGRRGQDQRARRPARPAEADHQRGAGQGRDPQSAARGPQASARRARRKRSTPPRPRTSESQVKIADLGQRLNVALAKKVQELARYRSDFFGKLREVLGVACRLPGGRRPLRVPVRRAVRFRLRRSQARGHAADRQARRRAEAARDADPARHRLGDAGSTATPTSSRSPTSNFPSNWELSAARAISVVRYLIDQGVPANRLVAAGFGEFQPLDPGDSDEALAKNRRIELKLTER